MKVAIVVTHLLGTGHLTRALTLARAFHMAGHKPIVVSGGMAVPHLDTSGLTLVQLPPLRSDGVNFSQLLDASSQTATDDYLTQRKAALCETIAGFAPDALITELFPFGRRVLKDEFLSLLGAAQSWPKRPRIFASIRDILAPPSKPKKASFAQETIAAYYDAVLVHSDPNITPLSLSWPVTQALEQQLRYTGFVAPAPAKPQPQGYGAGQVLVTAGGGNVGASLFSCTKQAARADANLAWRVLVGGQDAQMQCRELMHNAPANFTAEPARQDFRQMLYHAAASVSMCGYNTALDILQAGCPAVFVPFDAGNEVEQTIRATALAEQPGIEMLKTADLTAQSLLQATARALQAPRRAALTHAMDGAEATVQIVEDMCRGQDAG